MEFELNSLDNEKKIGVIYARYSSNNHKEGSSDGIIFFI